MGVSAATIPVRSGATEPRDVTLLELVGALCDVTEDDREVVATVVEMLQSGRVRLRGNFRGAPVSDFS
jgi:hypothetical protein